MELKLQSWTVFEAGGWGGGGGSRFSTKVLPADAHYLPISNVTNVTDHKAEEDLRVNMAIQFMPCWDPPILGTNTLMALKGASVQKQQ